jgi:anaerobic selenocysteine-containing dehydrogenase
MLHINHALGLGAQLVVIDPRRTQSSEQANLFIQPRPGTDGVLALAIAKVLIRENFTDETFIKKYVYGYHQYKVMLQSLSIREAAEIADVPEEKIRLLAEMIGKIRPVSINAGFGMQRYSNSGQTMRAIIALLALTGNIGKPGAGWIYANLQSSIFNKVKDPLAFYPPEKPDGLIRVAISTAKLGQDMLKTKDPALKMIWVERGNPVTQNPDTHTVLKAFRALDFRVVVDQFMTDTAREADLILPAKTMFEQSDVIGAYWHPYIQIKQKIIDPPGEVKPETEIYFLLARHLGFEKKKIERFIPEPGDEGVNKYLKEKLREFPDLTLDRLKQGPVISPFNQTIAFKDMKFKTPSGRIELYSREAIKRWKVPGTAVFSEPVEASMRSGTHKNVYPLFFMTPNTKNRIHSQFNNLAMIRQFSEKPGLQMHPDDALSRKIRNGDLVRIYNDRGEVKVEVELDYSIRRGCVAMTNGWWITEGGTVNFLSCGRETDMGFGAAFHENLVEVERVR